MRTFGRLLLVFVVLLLLAFGYWGYSPRPRRPALSAASSAGSLQIDGTTRTYKLYVPQGLGPGAPVLVVLHGLGLTGGLMEAWTGYEFDELADAHRFAVLYPDGAGRVWSNCRRDSGTAGEQNVVFLKAVVAQVRAQTGAGAGLYALGYSSGGQMALRLTADDPEVAGVAVAGASVIPSDDSVCDFSHRRVAAMLVNGTEDRINPYPGGEVTLFGMGHFGQVLSSRASAEVFAGAGSVAGSPAASHLDARRSGDPTSADVLTWAAAGQPPVALYTVVGGGHVFPQPAFRFPRLMGRTTSAVDMPREAVRFFGLEKRSPSHQ